MANILKDIRNESGYISAYNKNEIVFKCVPGEADSAIVSSQGYEVRLYPDPNGIFTFAAGEFAASVFSAFKDDYEYSESLDPDKEGSKLAHHFNFGVVLYKNSTPVEHLSLQHYNFLKSADQRNLGIKDLVGKYLAPTQNLKHYIGYPFEYSRLEKNKITRHLFCAGKACLHGQNNTGHTNLASNQNVEGEGLHKTEMLFFDWKNVDFESPAPATFFELGGIKFEAVINKKHGEVKGHKIRQHKYSYTYDKYRLPGDIKEALVLGSVWNTAKTKFDISFRATRNNIRVPLEIAVFDAFKTEPIFDSLKISTTGSPFTFWEKLGGKYGAWIGENTKALDFGNTTNSTHYPNSGSAIFTTSSEGEDLKIEVNGSLYKAIVFAVRLPKQKPEASKFEIVDKCGTYIKWRNQQGAYSYLLFESNRIKELSIKSLGTVYANNSDYPEQLGIGKKGRYTQKIYTRVPISEENVLHSLLLSPEVYIYEAERFSGENKWSRIRIVNKKLKYEDKGNNFIALTAICEVSEPVTQHL